ncbi:MAG: zf-TFIIB domain-containing protein [Gemmatimonadaceae bacterium]
MSIDDKPSRNEDEYFAKRDAELIRAARVRLDGERLKLERSVHYMKCPKCGADLAEREFQHMKIDVCSECRGTWLDAGELDMLTHVNRSVLSRFVGDMLDGIRRT